MIHAVGAREERLIEWRRSKRTQNQLAYRGKSPARGQMENRFPLLIAREIKFLEFLTDVLT